MMPTTLDLNPKFQEALGVLENGFDCCFITGRAGTGKSTLLSHFRKTTRKKVAVLAPTGVAAVTIRGQTIHSFFGFRPDITNERARRLASQALQQEKAGLYQKLDLIVIDEISMVRADLLDCIDIFLKVARKSPDKPFGGLRLAFIGDLYQLPPVVTTSERSIFSGYYESPYFFSARVFGSVMCPTIELETIYRQREARFIEILNAVRNNTVTEDQIDELNHRCLEGRPDAAEQDPEEIRICLTATNDQAAFQNEHRLHTLPGRTREFSSRVVGDFDEKSMPADRKLILKKGAQVMLLNNDPQGRWVNGTMGTVLSLPSASSQDGDTLTIGLGLQEGHQGGEIVDVEPHSWEIFRYSLDPSEKALTTETVGTFTQYPVKLAWAVTIHKAQGKTFDRVTIDTGRGLFATGQLYVALSRCRTLAGMHLKKPLRKSEAMVDRRVIEFLKGD